MRAATVAQIKKELKHLPPEELQALVLRLARFKKDNKELLTYLLFEAGDEYSYIESVKSMVDEGFDSINTRSTYFAKKSIRKILSGLRKFIRYSGKKETEVELLIHFCERMNTMQPPITRSQVLMNLYDRLVAKIRATVLKLDEDLRYDYSVELKSRLDEELLNGARLLP